MQKIKPKTVTTEAHPQKPDELEPSIVKKMEPMREKKVTINMPLVVMALAIIIAGGFTGFVLAQGGGEGGTSAVTGTGGGLAKVVGVADEKTFKDSAEGTLREGGLDNEGTHHLERPGGASQNVYLTSSTVGLDEYTGKKVKVWGETFDSEKAGWLMDVGRLELLD